MKIQLSEHFTYKKLFRFCLPTIGMMLCTSLYGIADGYFVLNYVGKAAFASVNLIMLGSGTAMALSARIFAAPLSAVFAGYDMELSAMPQNALAIYAFSFMLYGINIFASSFFTALNNGVISAAISFLRTLVFHFRPWPYCFCPSCWVLTESGGQSQLQRALPLWSLRASLPATGKNTITCKKRDPTFSYT